MTNHTHSTSSRPEIIRSKTMTSYKSYIKELTLISHQRKLTTLNFVLKIIQNQQPFDKNIRVKTVDKLLQLIQRINSDFKPN